jgi:hypothetical protein
MERLHDWIEYKFPEKSKALEEDEEEEAEGAGPEDDVEAEEDL